MTHIKYHSEAIVLSGTPIGEANKLLHLFTKDFGLIAAYAQSILDPASKLRFGLQDLAYSRVDLIATKHGFKIVSAVYIKNFLSVSLAAPLRAEEQKSAPIIMGRIVNLLRRLLKGEEKNEMLFIDVAKGFSFLSGEGLKEEDALAAEIVLVMRILNHLGYWGDDATLSPFLAGDVLSQEHIERIKKEKPRAVGAINRALVETQL